MQIHLRHLCPFAFWGTQTACARCQAVTGQEIECTSARPMQCQWPDSVSRVFRSFPTVDPGVDTLAERAPHPTFPAPRSRGEHLPTVVCPTRCPLPYVRALRSPASRTVDPSPAPTRESLKANAAVMCSIPLMGWCASVQHLWLLAPTRCERASPASPATGEHTPRFRPGLWRHHHIATDARGMAWLPVQSVS